MPNTANVFIVAAYLGISKPFCILQRVIKRQKVLTSLEHNKSQYLSSQKNLLLNILKFSGLTQRQFR